MGVRIVTDSGCDLPPKLGEEIRDLGVKIVPFFFHFGLEGHEDKTMPMEEFLARAKEIWPTTAAPSDGVFAEAFRKYVEAGDQVVCISVTSKHSFTYSSAVLASKEFSPGQVEVVDSLSLSLGQGILVLAAARAADEGRSLEEVVKVIKDLQKRLHLFVTLDTVKYLVLGGRASRLEGTLAGLLRIRPLLSVRDGELTVLEKPRGRETAKRRLIEVATEHFPAEMVGIIHIVCEEEAQELAWKISLQTGFPKEKILLIETGMALATHGGPGALGVVVVSKTATDPF